MADWAPTSIQEIGFSSIEETAPYYDERVDYSYFTKTGFGFAIEEENAKLYFNEAMEYAKEMLPDMFNGDDMLDMYAEYYVSGGALSGIRVNADIELHFTKQGVVADAVESVILYTTIKDYGTTVIDSPVD